jgi:hypothetical protein
MNNSQKKTSLFGSKQLILPSSKSKERYDGKCKEKAVEGNQKIRFNRVKVPKKKGNDDLDFVRTSEGEFRDRVKESLDMRPII